MVVIYESSRMRHERCATGAMRGKSRMGKIQSSKFAVRSSENLKLGPRTFASRLSRQSRVSRAEILLARVWMEK
jgi:hypothetical protein